MTGKKSVKLPLFLIQRIDKLASGGARRGGLARWQVVDQALTLYEISQRKRKKLETNELDVICWYIVKVCMSAGVFKAQPTADNLQRLIKNLEEVSDRLNIDLSDVIEAVKTVDFSKSSRAVLNAAMKRFVAALISTPSESG